MTSVSALSFRSNTAFIDVSTSVVFSPGSVAGDTGAGVGSYIVGAVGVAATDTGKVAVSALININTANKGFMVAITCIVLIKMTPSIKRIFIKYLCYMYRSSFQHYWYRKPSYCNSLKCRYC